MLNKLKEVFERVKVTMLDRGTLKRVIGEETAVSDAMRESIERWGAMYASPFGLHLPSAVASEYARMITVEMKSEISGSRRAEYLNGVYKDLIENIRIPVEYGCAQGGLIFKPYVEDGAIKIDTVQAGGFYPTEFDSAGRITGAIFVQKAVRGRTYLTRLEHHRLIGKNYTIINKAFRSFSEATLGQEISLDESEVWSGMAESLTIGNVKKPLFGYFRPAAANTVDPSSPLGASVFAGAENLMEDADKQYERYLWEFESGERAIIANSMAFRLGEDGKPKLPDRRLYRTMDVESMDFFREWSPELREDALANGMDRIFRQVEFCCGLAYGTLSDVTDSDKTAEEIRASKQRSYTSVRDNQKSLKNALTDTVYAMDVWCTLYNLTPMGSYNITFDFDDSIAADRKTEFEEKKTLVEKGIMAPWEFRMWYFGEDEDAAKSTIGNVK